MTTVNVLRITVCVFQELQEMLERHYSKNEAWLRGQAQENDLERRELCRLRVSKQCHFSCLGFFLIPCSRYFLKAAIVPNIHACLMDLSLGGGVAGAGDTEGGTEQHPETQRSSSVYHAAVQRNVRWVDRQIV